MVAAIYSAGLILLMLAGYFEWETRSQLWTRPHIVETAFKVVASFSILSWIGFCVTSFFQFYWYMSLLTIFASIVAPAFVVQKLIDKNMPGAVVYGSFLLGFFLCVIAVNMGS